MLEPINIQTADVKVGKIQPAYSYNISPEMNANILLKKAEHPFGFTVQEFKTGLQEQISAHFNEHYDSISEQVTDEEIDELLKPLQDKYERVSNFSEVIRDGIGYYRIGQILKIEFDKEFTLRSETSSATFKLVKNQTLKNIENQINADFERQKPFEQYKDIQWVPPYDEMVRNAFESANISFLEESSRFENIYLFLIDFNDKTMIIEV